MRAIRQEDIIDKKAMEQIQNRKQQIQLQSGTSQNLIDILTMLLKPQLQFNGNNQRRSHSLNSFQSRYPQMSGGGFNQQMMNQSQMGRSNNFRGNRMNQQRGHSQVPHHSHQMMNGQMMPQMANQMVPGAPSMNSGSTVPIGVPNQFANQYQQEVQRMFQTQQFKEGSVEDKKDLVGNTIYKYVEKIVGEQKAPKITGMLIDLPEIELNFSISNWNNFCQKVKSAYELIQESEIRAPAGAQVSPKPLQIVHAQ
jgi:hypothetical protein